MSGSIKLSQLPAGSSPTTDATSLVAVQTVSGAPVDVLLPMDTMQYVGESIVLSGGATVAFLNVNSPAPTPSRPEGWALAVNLTGVGPILNLKDVNSPASGFVCEAYTTLQFGLANATASVQGAIAPNTWQSCFGISQSGQVGSLTNGIFNTPVFRNIFDDGSGNASISGALSLTQYTSLAGTTAGTIDWAQYLQGEFKAFGAQALAYENDTTTAQTITFPTPFTNTPVVTTNTSGLTLTVTTTTLTITAPDVTTTYSGVIEVKGF